MLDLHIDLYICNFSLKFHCCRMESLAGVACIGHFILVTCVLLVFFCNLVLLSLWRTPRAAHLLTLYPVQYHRPMEIPLMQVAFFCSIPGNGCLLFYLLLWCWCPPGNICLGLASWNLSYFFHFSCNGSFQLGKWNKLSAGYWQCPHSKTTMQSRYLAWIIYQNSCCIKVP